MTDVYQSCQQACICYTFSVFLVLQTKYFRVQQAACQPLLDTIKHPSQNFGNEDPSWWRDRASPMSALRSWGVAFGYWVTEGVLRTNLYWSTCTNDKRTYKSANNLAGNETQYVWNPITPLVELLSRSELHFKVRSRFYTESKARAFLFSLFTFQDCIGFSSVIHMGPNSQQTIVVGR